MPHGGSYDIGSFSSDIEAEIRRLNAQVDLFWPVERELFPRFGLKDGMDVLDCGCGPGRLLELLKASMPALACVGLEIDGLLVEEGRKRIAGSGLTDCTILQGSAEKPGMDPGSFDFIILRMVLEHVPDPAAALRSLTALLRPGGRIAVVSNDFDHHLRTDPAVPELEVLYAAYRASRRRDGGDPCLGRRVPRLLMDAGLRLVGCEIELAHNAVLGDGPFLKAEGAGIPMQLVKSGFLGEKTLEELTRSWRAMLSAPGHSIARILWAAAGEKTDAEAKSPAPDGIAVREASESAARPDRDTVGMLLELLAAALKRKDIAPDASMASLGVDSITAIVMQERIKNLTGVEISIMRLLGAQSVHSLAAELDSRTVRRAASGDEKRRVTKWEVGEL